MCLLLRVAYLESAGDNYIRVSLCAPVEKFEEAIQRIKASQTPPKEGLSA